jgi:hypothetical protein
MKKIIPICIVGLFLFSGLTVIAQPAHQNTSEFATVQFSQPTLISENNYITVSLNEANNYLMKQGKPLLPSYTQTFYYPFKTTITSVTVIPSDIQTQTLTRDITPTPKAVAIEDSTISAQAPVNYGTDSYPGAWYTYDVGCGLNGQTLSVIVTVDIYPIQYHPAEKTIESAGSASIIIDTQPAPAPQNSPRDSYSLVVIGPTSYATPISTFVNHKIGMGLTTKFVSLDEIYAGTYFPVNGRDNAEKMKYFIKDAIEQWGTTSVLLVGGNGIVPTRDTHVHIADDPDYGYEVFTSDLYFADIYNKTGAFASWDTNGNNIFGEYNWYGATDAVDCHPDVYLARLPATGSSQVTTAVNKIISYDNTPGYQQSWFPSLVVVGGDSFPDSGSVDEGQYVNTKIETLMTGFNPTELWATNGMLNSLAPTGVQNIINTISLGCGFVDFNGHGNTNVWATHPHDNFNTWLPTPLGFISSSNLQSLSNGNKLPIVTVDACSTAKFAEDPSCFNWAIMYAANGGAIGTFGATGLGYSYVGTGVTSGLMGKLDLDTYKAYKTDHASTLGEMWGRALNRYIKSNMEDGDYKCVEEWVLFGDPSMQIGEASNPPAKPATPSGTTNGDVGTSYTYSSSTTDPDGDQVYYMFDWNDGTTSGWLGPYNSGASVVGTKTWNTKGTYQVKVVAKDTHGVLSEWSDPLPVMMPLGFVFHHPFLQLLEKLLEQYPNAFPFLRSLLK